MLGNSRLGTWFAVHQTESPVRGLAFVLRSNQKKAKPGITSIFQRWDCYSLALEGNAVLGPLNFLQQPIELRIP